MLINQLRFLSIAEAVKKQLREKKFPRKKKIKEEKLFSKTV